MIFLVILILAVVWILTGGLQSARKVASYPSLPLASGITPKISVVAFATRNVEDLSSYLEALFAQDYPDFEVILVCDASAETTAMISEKFENVKNLHITFIPPGSHSLSRRKLAWTIGAKAAKGEVVITTTTGALPQSNLWLRSMATPFADHDNVAAIGYVKPNPSQLPRLNRSYKIFDILMDAIQSLGAAIASHPFRGDCRNLAFRRNVFFKVKGYASSITIMDGDDDIFIRDISRLGECKAMINPEAILLANCGEDAERLRIDRKDRHNFTRHFLPRWPFQQAGLSSICRWLALICAILTTLAAIPSLTDLPAASAYPEIVKELFPVPFGFPTPIVAMAAAIAALPLYIITAIIDVLTIRKCAEKLEVKIPGAKILPFLLWRPIGNLIFHFNHISLANSHYCRHN